MKIMKKYFLVFCFLFISNELISQSNLLNASTPTDIGKKTEKQISLDFNEPLDHPYVDDKDVLWSKIVYEYVDGYEQFNYPLFYPQFIWYFSYPFYDVIELCSYITDQCVCIIHLWEKYSY